MTGKRCRGGRRGCRREAIKDGRRCGECEYAFQKSQTQKLRTSEEMQRSLADIARQVAVMERDPFYRRAD